MRRSTSSGIIAGGWDDSRRWQTPLSLNHWVLLRITVFLRSLTVVNFLWTT